MVSEIGEMWSPHTAPERMAATLNTSMLELPKIATAIGIRIPNVPHEVPVAKASPKEMIKNRNGIMEAMKVYWLTIALTNPPMFR